MTRQSGPRPQGNAPVHPSPSAVSREEISLGPRAVKAKTLKRIDAALRRLETGRFGHCLYCGDQISVTRLTFDPAVTSCSTCDED